MPAPSARRSWLNARQLAEPLAMSQPNPFKPVVLCLSGHDPSGGAGLQADIEALIAQGCHAAPTVTALTVQDTVDVSDFRVLDREWVLAQANKVISDMPVSAVKLGMLGSVEMVDTVLELMQRLPDTPARRRRRLAGQGRRRLCHSRTPVPGGRHRHAQSAGGTHSG